MWRIPRSRTCQWNFDWNSEPLSVWTASTWKGEFLEDVIEELDGGELVVLRIDPQHTQSGAVVDCCVLVVLFLSGASDGFDGLDVDLDLMARQRLLVAFPTAIVGLVSLVRRQTVHVEALRDSPHPRVRDLDVVVAGQVHRDLRRAEMVMLAQVDDLADHVGVGCQRTEMRFARSVS